MVFRVLGMRSAPIPHQFFAAHQFLTCQNGVLFELFDGIGKRCIGNMDITIHGCFDARMTEQLLQDFRHNSAFNRTSQYWI